MILLGLWHKSYKTTRTIFIHDRDQCRCDIGLGFVCVDSFHPQFHGFALVSAGVQGFQPVGNLPDGVVLRNWRFPLVFAAKIARFITDLFPLIHDLLHPFKNCPVDGFRQGVFNAYGVGL